MLGLIGTSFRHGSLSRLGRYTFPRSQLAERTRALRQACGFAEMVYLATCNRVEVVFWGDSHTSTAQCRQFFGDQDAEQVWHAFSGEEAAEHLFLVATGLDSLVLGDGQVLGQVKAAYALARELGLAGPQLGLVFQEAFRVAKLVQRQTGLGTGGKSMLSLATALLEERLAAGGRLALVGAGDMTQRCAQRFAPRGDVQLLFVNRTLAKAQELAQQYRGQAMGLDAFRAAPPQLAALLTATASPEPILGRAELERLASALVIDLAVPSDVDAAAAQGLPIELYQLDRLAALQVRAAPSTQALRAPGGAGNLGDHPVSNGAQVARAQLLIHQGLAQLRRRLAERELGPAIVALRRRYRHTVHQELQALVAELGLGATPEQVARWAERLSNRMAHIPTVGLKHIAWHQGPSAAQAFLDAVSSELDGEEDL